MSHNHHFAKNKDYDSVQDALSILQVLVDNGPYERTSKATRWDTIFNDIAVKNGLRCWSDHDEGLETFTANVRLKYFNDQLETYFKICCSMRIELEPLKPNSKRMKEIGNFIREDAFIHLPVNSTRTQTLALPINTPIESIQEFLERQHLKSLNDLVKARETYVVNSQAALQEAIRQAEDAAKRLMTLPEGIPRIVVE
jgi:hypothetical protein